MAVTTDEPILVGLKNSDPDPSQWEVVGDFIASEPYAVGMVENESKLRDAVNFALMDMWRSGKFQEYYTTWFGEGTKVPYSAALANGNLALSLPVYNSGSPSAGDDPPGSSFRPGPEAGPDDPQAPAYS